MVAVSLGAFQAHAADFSLSAPGASDDLRASLVAASQSAATNGEANATPLEIVAAAQADYARLTAALYDAGYFGGVISIKIDGREAASIAPILAPSSVSSVAVTVEPGSLFRFGRAELAPLRSVAEPPSEFATGQPARTGAIRSAAAFAIESWRDAGYAKASVADQQITARHSENALDVAVQIETGPQLRFGDLIITGNSAVRTERIAEIAGLPSGQIFSPAELDRASNRLRRTGTFKSAALTEAESANPNDTLDITAQIAESPPRRFGFGAELSTVEGLGVNGFWLHRNLFGGAERLRFDAEISGVGGDTGGVDYSLGVRFDRPATFNQDTDFFIEAEVESLDQVNFSSDQVRLNAGIVRFARDERQYRFGLGLWRARTQDVFGEQDFLLLTVPMGLQFDYRDNAFDAKEGYFLDLEVMPFFSLEGSEDGVRSTADLRGYYTPGGSDGRVTLALRGQLGSLTGPGISNTPADYLFFSGGGGTVRGQSFQSLGIDVGADDLAGGRGFLGLSGEARIKTGDALSVVGFIDAGYIGEESFPNGSSGEWHTGAGLGLRYDTGIGPIRFDVGVPVSGPGDNSGFEIYIGIGQAF